MSTTQTKRTSEPIPEVPLYKNHGSCYDVSSGKPVVPLSLPFIIHKLPPSRPGTEPLVGSRTGLRLNAFAGSAEDIDGRPRTAATMQFEEEERVKTPALGFQGWYIGKKEGKVGVVNVHTQRISEWESYDNNAAATSPVAGKTSAGAPAPPYLEIASDMLEYGEQEKFVYRYRVAGLTANCITRVHMNTSLRLHLCLFFHTPSGSTHTRKYPNLYTLRVAEKAAALSSPLKTDGAAKQRAAASPLPAVAAPSSPTSVAFRFDSPGSGGAFDKPTSTRVDSTFNEGPAVAAGDAARLDALMGAFLQHVQQKWPRKFRRQRNIDQVFAGRDLARCGSLPEPDFRTCLRFVVSADPAADDYALLVKTFQDPHLHGCVSYEAFTHQLFARDNEPRGIKMSPFPK